MRKYVQFKRGIKDNADEGDDVDGNRHQPHDIYVNAPSRDIVGPSIEIGKVSGYDSEYMESSNPDEICDDTDEGSDADDANIPLQDFYIDLMFENLKIFKTQFV